LLDEVRLRGADHCAKIFAILAQWSVGGLNRTASNHCANELAFLEALYGLTNK
jgi:hypothetical protein